MLYHNSRLDTSGTPGGHVRDVFMQSALADKVFVCFVRCMYTDGMPSDAHLRLAAAQSRVPEEHARMIAGQEEIGPRVMERVNPQLLTKDETTQR